MNCVRSRKGVFALLLVDAGVVSALQGVVHGHELLSAGDYGVAHAALLIPPDASLQQEFLLPHGVLRRLGQIGDQLLDIFVALEIIAEVVEKLSCENAAAYGKGVPVRAALFVRQPHPAQADRSGIVKGALGPSAFVHGSSPPPGHEKSLAPKAPSQTNCFCVLHYLTFGAFHAIIKLQKESN